MFVARWFNFFQNWKFALHVKKFLKLTPYEFVCVDRPSRRVAKGSSSSAKNLTADVTKTSKHPSSSSTTSSSTESPTCRERSSERQKTRRSSKSKEPSSSDNNNNNHSPTLSLPDVPRQTRRKKTTRTKPHLAPETYKSPHSDPGSTTATGSISLSKDSDLCQTP